MRIKMIVGALALALVTSFGCGKKDDKGGGDKDKAADKDKGGGGDKEYADVDCNKIIDHVGGLLIDEGTKGKSAAEIDTIKKKMKDQRPKMIEACEKEKPTKKLTPKQYDCVLGAKTVADLGACEKA